MNVDLSLLNRASITYDYLHTNSTTHEFLFGAIAELVDNARDAQAKTIHIDYGSGQLSFLDDGCGMDKDEVISIVSFGYSTKRLDPNMVGQYGNGLKSGAMRIGKDFILFTKKEGLMTCMLLSRSFHEENNLKEVIVPTPSFLEDRRPYYENQQQMQKHSMETQIIYQYSPFQTEDELFSQFVRITSETGTLIICYNLRRIESGAYEMDFTTDTFDVRLTEHLREKEEENNSLRAYLSVLYMNPRMRIFLRGNKVDTKRILSTLYKPRMYRYKAKNLKACAERELEKCEKKSVELADRVAQCKSELANFELTYPRYMTDPSLRVRYRTLVKAVDDAEEMVAVTEIRTKKLQKSKADPNPLIYYFGFNIHHRDRCGCMVYNNGRLIRMYEKLAVQKEINDGMMKYLGVVAVVDIPYSVLEPTHNKQSFENKREYMNVLKSVNDHLIQYWIDVAIGATSGGVSGFWKNFGYDSNAWDAIASDKIEFVKKRLASVGMSVQCDICLKWRHLDFDPSFLTDGIPKDWRCTMHPNSLFRYCSKLEELPKIPEGRLMKMPEKPPHTMPGSRRSVRKTVIEKVEPVKKTIIKPKSRIQPTISSKANPVSRPIRQAAQRAVYREESEFDFEVDSPLQRRSSRTSVRLGKMRETKIASKKEETKIAAARESEAFLRQQYERKLTRAKQEELEPAVSQKNQALQADDNRRSLRKAREREMTPLHGTLRKVAECLAESPQTKRSRSGELTADSNAHDDEASAASGSESVFLASESPKPLIHDIAATTSDNTTKMDEVVQKFSHLVSFFKPSTVETKEIQNIRDVIDFDLQSFLASYKACLDELIREQVQNQIGKHIDNIIRLMEWSCPEVEGTMTRANVFEKLEELLNLM